MNAPFNFVSPSPSISLLIIILASFLTTTQLNSLAGCGLPNLLNIRHLALNSNTKSPKAFLKIPVSVPFPALREPE